MPITSSAKKALRVSKRKRVFNLRSKSAIDTIIKKFNKFINGKKFKEAQALISELQQIVDKAAKTGYIKPNTAGRIKSRAVAKLLKIK